MAWQIDSAHSLIQFSVRHMMISTVRGRFEKFSGLIELDEKNPANTTVSVDIDVASVNTNEDKRDNHLRSADFFYAEKFPLMKFRSKKVELTDATHARLIGDLTIRDVTHEVILAVEYTGQAKSPWGMVSAGFNAQTKINRTAWGLTWNQVLETGGMLVGEDININLELELIKQPEAQLSVA